VTLFVVRPFSTKIVTSLAFSIDFFRPGGLFPLGDVRRAGAGFRSSPPNGVWPLIFCLVYFCSRGARPLRGSSALHGAGSLPALFSDFVAPFFGFLIFLLFQRALDVGSFSPNGRYLIPFCAFSPLFSGALPPFVGRRFFPASFSERGRGSAPFRYKTPSSREAFSRPLNYFLTLVILILQVKRFPFPCRSFFGFEPSFFGPPCEDALSLLVSRPPHRRFIWFFASMKASSIS